MVAYNIYIYVCFYKNKGIVYLQILLYINIYIYIYINCIKYCIRLQIKNWNIFLGWMQNISRLRGSLCTA